MDVRKISRVSEYSMKKEFDFLEEKIGVAEGEDPEGE